MDPLTIAAIGSQAAAGLVQGITGIFQSAKANKMAKSNIRPFYKIQKPILDNQAIAESRASKGLSDASKELYIQESDRGITSGIDAITTGGGTVNNIADLYTARNNGVTKMALIDDAMRVNNMKNLTEQNNVLADAEDKQWQVNEWGPYADKAQAAAALKKQGSENTWKGVNTVVGAVANAATAKQYDKEQSGVFAGRHTDPVYSVDAPDNMPTSSGRTFNTTAPLPFQSSVLRNRTTTTQTIQNKYPGLMMGRGNLSPVWSAELGTMVDPITGQPL